MRPLSLPALALALTAASVPAPAATPEFDDQRLLTTPAQRAHLDELRDGTSVRRAGDGRSGQALVPEARRTPPSVRMRGFVRRSDGPPAVWLNDDSTLAGDDVGGDLRVRSGRIEGNSVVVDLPDGRHVHIKPGQTWDPESGRVVDDYRR